MENITYQEVPNIITGKDLDYLSDMFNWNYEGLKRADNAINNVNDAEISSVLEKAYNLFNNNLNVILSILNRGGANE